MEIGEAEIEAAHKLSSPPEHPLLPRLRHRRLMAFLQDQGFNDSYNEVMNKTRAYMSLTHLRCLVERGQWGDAAEYLERYLPPNRRRSLHAEVFLMFLMMHHRFAKAVDGSVDNFVPRNYLQLSNGRAVSHAELRLRSISLSILAVDEVRANMNWQAVRNKASLVVYSLAHSTPELRGCMELPVTSNKPHHVLPIASRLWSRRPYVKKKNKSRRRRKAIIRALKRQSFMVPTIGSVEEAQELLADLLDETVRDGVQVITYGQCRPLQPGGNEGAQSCQPMLDTFRAAKTYSTLANAGTNKPLAEPGSHTNTARQDLDGRKNSREEPAIVEEAHDPKQQRSNGAFGDASLDSHTNTASQDLDGRKNSREEPAIVEEAHDPKRRQSNGAFGDASLGVPGPGAVADLVVKLNGASSG